MTTSIALIPPVPNLKDFETTGTCLLLAHLCQDPKYVEYYRTRGSRGDFLILDNSAFELGSAELDMPTLLAYSMHMRCKELVAPDSIMNQHETLGKTLAAVAWMGSYVGQATWKRAGSPRIMIVPQIDPTREEIDDYLTHAADMLSAWTIGAPYLQGHITLGVSKNMNMVHGGWLMIFREVIRPLVQEFGVQVHCLGLPKSLATVKKVVKENPYIRSLDTALPFVCAAHNEALDNGIKELPKRPSNFLTTKLTRDQIDLALRNIAYLQDTFRETALL